jgi:TPR repeat protein
MTPARPVAPQSANNSNASNGADPSNQPRPAPAAGNGPDAQRAEQVPQGPRTKVMADGQPAAVLALETARQPPVVQPAKASQASLSPSPDGSPQSEEILTQSAAAPEPAVHQPQIEVPAIPAPAPAPAPSAQVTIADLHQAYDAKNYGRSFEIAQKLAEEGDPDAQYLLGSLLADGNGPRQNDKEAYGWLLKAAGQGNKNAQARVGVMLRDGTGVDRNECDAFDWFKMAAAQSQRMAQYEVGTYYERGVCGTRRSIDGAKKYYRLSDAQGYPQAGEALQRLEKR